MIGGDWVSPSPKEGGLLWSAVRIESDRMWVADGTGSVVVLLECATPRQSTLDAMALCDVPVFRVETGFETRGR